MSAEKFERSLEKLEAIVKKLEQGELDLEASLKEFEEGVRLARVCEKRLTEAEKKVEILLKKNGDLIAEPFHPTAESGAESPRPGGEESS